MQLISTVNPYLLQYTIDVLGLERSTIMKDWPDPKLDNSPVSRIEMAFVLALTLLAFLIPALDWFGY